VGQGTPPLRLPSRSSWQQGAALCPTPRVLCCAYVHACMCATATAGLAIVREGHVLLPELPAASSGTCMTATCAICRPRVPRHAICAVRECQPYGSQGRQATRTGCLLALSAAQHEPPSMPSMMSQSAAGGSGPAVCFVAVRALFTVGRGRYSYTRWLRGCSGIQDRHRRCVRDSAAAIGVNAARPPRQARRVPAARTALSPSGEPLALSSRVSPCRTPRPHMNVRVVCHVS